MLDADAAATIPSCGRGGGLHKTKFTVEGYYWKIGGGGGWQGEDIAREHTCHAMIHFFIRQFTPLSFAMPNRYFHPFTHIRFPLWKDRLLVATLSLSASKFVLVTTTFGEPAAQSAR